MIRLYKSFMVFKMNLIVGCCLTDNFAWYSHILILTETNILHLSAMGSNSFLLYVFCLLLRF